MKENYNYPIQVSGKRSNEEEESSLVDLVWRYLRYWKWLVLGVAVALVGAAVYLYYATPVYKISSSVILKDVQTTQRSTPAMGNLDELALLGAVWRRR